MNKIFRIVWSAARQSYIVAHEKACACGKPSSLQRGMAAGLLGSLLAGLALAQTPPPNALPTGGQIVAGQGAITQAGNTLTVTQNTDRLIANWSTFNIGQNAAVQFMQPGASSVALNRIHDQNPSQIFGSLTANGQVFLVNPAGITFGPTARVDVGGLVAASLNLSNEHFLNGHYRLEGAGASGAVLNQGTLRTANGGYLAFIAPKVTNEGMLSAPNGTVAMAAGNQVSVDFVGDKLVTFTVDQGAVHALAENKGLIQADGGLVMMTAKAADSLTQAVVNTSGVIEAKGISAQGGRIVLDAEGGQTTVSGTLDVASEAGKGGRVVATGDRVLVKDGAHLTASGKTGGGDVLVGGSWQNSDSSVRQATGTVIQAGARLEANATDNGDGGTVVAWSDITKTNSVTRAYGTFEAKGGVNGGNGGRIETSGHWLDVAGSQGGASAAKGKAGLWLLDPYDVTIDPGLDLTFGNFSAGDPQIWTPSASGSSVSADLITGKLSTGTSVTVTTNGAGAEIGDITLRRGITKYDGNTDVTLTLQAANSIIVDQAISNTGGTGKLNVVLDADNNNGVGDGAGVVMLNADITTNGGNLSFGTGRTVNIGGLNTLVGGDVFVAGAGARTISTNGGNVDVQGEMIVANTNGLNINSANGNIRFYGLLNSGNSYSFVQNWNGGANGVWTSALTNAKSGTGNSVGDTYLAAITSRLENAIASRTASYAESWLGARRVIGIGTNSYWRWLAGPEGLEDSGNGRIFFQQNASGGSGTAINNNYSNWVTGEPNNWGGAGAASLDLAKETALQFVGNLGKWNDLSANSSEFETKNLPYVKETNLAASPINITAGSGNVTFSGAVGNSKALASLNVTSTGTIAINGSAVTSEGLQTYNGNVTVGAASTVLTQTSANTDFTLQAGKSITNGSASDKSLTIKTTGNILMDAGSSISSGAGKLNTILWSDSDNSGSGHIFVHDGNTISTNGGNLVMAGGLDDGGNGGVAADGTPDGYAVSTVATASGVSIGRNANAANATTTINTGGGNILMRGKSTGGNPSMGIHFAYGGTLNAGSGTLTMLGESANYAGIELSAWLDKPGTNYLDINAASVDIRGKTSNANYHGLASSQLNNEYTRITAGAGGIYLYGHNTANTAKGVEISLNATTTGGGNITVESPNYIALYAGANAHSFNAGTGNTTLKTNVLSIGANHTLAGSGTMTVEPYTAGTTIGVAGGAGTLQIPASYFTTNFTNGFSGITIGNATAGLVTIGNTALSYNDPLTLKTGNSLFFSSGSALTGNGNALTLWSRAGGNNAADDAVLGSVWMPVGSSVNTGGGHVVIGGGADPLIGYALGDTGAGSAENNARYRGVTLNGTLAAGGGNITIHGRGTGAAARGVSIGGTLTTNGAGTITAAGTASGTSDGLALGDSSVGGISGVVLTANGALSLTGSIDTGTNGINISTAGSRIETTGSGNAVLNATSGNINGTGSLIIGGSTTLTANAANNITLGNSSNNFTGTVSVVSGKNIAIVDSNAMTLGAVNATGTVYAGALNGDLTLTGAIATTDATANAVKLNAGENAAAGTAAGGDIKVTGGSVSVGAGGFATLYSGSVAGSTGLTALIGSGSGRFRYNSDETAANYTAALTAGVNALYRERPTVTVTATNANKVYDGAAYTGGNGVTSAGLVNGDTAALLGGVLTYGGNSQGAINTGTYTITPGGLTDTRGYLLAFANGTLTVSPAPLTVIAGNLTGTVSKVYDGTSTATLSPANYQLTGWVGADGATVTKTNGTYDNPNAGSNKLVTVALSSSDYVPMSGTNLANYDLPTQISGSVGTITPAPLTVTANAAHKVYDGIAYTGGNGVSYSGFVANETAAVLGGSLAYGGSSQGAVNAGSYVITPSGLSSGNYTIAYRDGALTISTAPLVVIAGNLTGTVSKVYDGTSTATLSPANYRLTGWVGTDGATVTKTNGTYDNPNAGSNKLVTVALSSSDYAATGSTNLANYDLPTQISGAVGAITPAPLTVTANAASKTYDGTAYRGGNGVTYSGFVANESASVLGGTLAYGGSSQGAVNPGSYVITPSGFSSGNYAIAYRDGVLTVASKPVSPVETPLPPVEQQGINGTQDNSASSSSASAAPSGMGPGSGSTTLASLTSSSLVTGTPTEGAAAVLASSNVSSPVRFSSSGQGAILQLGKAAESAALAEVGLLPVFSAAASGMTLQGSFVLKESDAALALSPAPTRPETQPVIDAAASPNAQPFSLTLHNGVVQRMTATLLPSGLLLIDVPDSVNADTLTQIVLMGLQVLRQELKTQLHNVTSVVVRRT